jgi:hypothetical protein
MNKYISASVVDIGNPGQRPILQQLEDTIHDPMQSVTSETGRIPGDEVFRVAQPTQCRAVHASSMSLSPPASMRSILTPRCPRPRARTISIEI